MILYRLCERSQFIQAHRDIGMTIRLRESWK
jgi:hypothetical protein